ncbi:uncharacterized protein LOC120336433 [Styela clava]
MIRMTETAVTRLISDPTKIPSSINGIYPTTNLSCEYNTEPHPAFDILPQLADHENGMTTGHLGLDMNNIRLQVPPRKTYDHIQDKELRKKMKNRESAQAARDRKKAKMVFLENKVSELLERNRYLEHENENLRKWIQKVDTSYFWNSKASNNHNQHISFPATYSGSPGISNSPESVDSVDHDQTMQYTYANNANNTFPLTIDANMEKQHPIAIVADCVSREETERRDVYGVKKYAGIQENTNSITSRHPDEQRFSTANQMNNCNLIASQESVEFPSASNQDWLMSAYMKPGLSSNTRHSIDEVGPLFNDGINGAECEFKWDTNCSTISGSPDYQGRRHHQNNIIPYCTATNIATMSSPDMSGESTISSPCSTDMTHGLVEENFMLQVH